MIEAVKTYANFHAYLTGNATDTALTVSTTDAAVLESWRSNFTASGTCRLLVGNSATYDSRYYAFETFLVSSIDTDTGVIHTQNSLSGETNYTTAKSTHRS